MAEIQVKPLSGEEIVISGVSGVFPSSNNVAELMNNLYNQVDMITMDETIDHPEIPKHKGVISGKDKFDAQFFRVTPKQAFTMDIMGKKVIENSYTAMYDAGFNPMSTEEKRVGVYVGTHYTDFTSTFFYKSTVSKNGFVLTGGSKTMWANRVSYYMDSKTTTYALDAACASSMACLERACHDIRNGICEAAIVGGCQVIIDEGLTLNLKRFGVLCMDGKTKCFDRNGDGYVRSEAVGVIFLQKAKDAKRIYAEVLHHKAEFSLKPEEALDKVRSKENIEEFLDKFYSEINVSKHDVEYVEAHGEAIAKADANELEAISDVFAQKSPVKVGCVKSNIGHTSSASGVCALIKMCLAYNKGELPANLHYSDALDIPSMREGKVKVVAVNTAFDRRLAAINNFSFTGYNCHTLLKGHYKKKDAKRYSCDIPRLVCVSGRHENAVKKIFNLLKQQPDPEVIGMMHNIYKYDTSGHTCRGYVIIDDKKEPNLVSESVEINPGGRRPLCLVFSGMGSQWSGMGAQLMRIPIFAAAIEKCHRVLSPKGLDIVGIISNEDKTIFDNILNCFVGIAAVQIGLTDVLKELGVVPDYIIGHSVGEIGCAYMDGCFTAEETILASYTRGMVSVETEFIKGAMAALGLGYKNAVQMTPPDIDIACHNSSSSCTISGPQDSIRKFVNELSSQGVFAKEVPCANIAYHSRYIQNAGPEFRKRLSALIERPVARSDKWICSSLPPERWQEPQAKLSSAEYHANNLLSPVYFEEAARSIPPNAVVVEVAPHGLLQAILKKSHPDCVHVPLTRRGHVDPLRFLFEAIGKLYQEGYNPQVEVLYPKIEYPVSTETPPISHFVEWQHEENWILDTSNPSRNTMSQMRKIVVSLNDEDYKYLAGNNIGGNILYPESAILLQVWQTLAIHKGVNINDMSVAFHNVYFYADVIIKDEEILILHIEINRANEYFEVTRDETLLASGYIGEMKKAVRFSQDLPENSDDISLSTDDIYKLMNIKGHCYSNEFQSIKTSTLDGRTAQVQWNKNWVTFLNSLIQLNILGRNHDGVSRPRFIQHLNIDINEHNTEKIIKSDEEYFTAILDVYSGVTKCGGVEIKDIHFDDKEAYDGEPDVLLTREFIPYQGVRNVQMDTALQILLQIVADNAATDFINITSADTEINEVMDKIDHVSRNIRNVTFKLVQNDSLDESDDIDLLVGQGLVKDINLISNSCVMKDHTFILSVEDSLPTTNSLDEISTITVGRKHLILLRKPVEVDTVFVDVYNEQKYSWISRLHELNNETRIVLVSRREAHSGLFGLVQILSKQHRNKIGLIVVDEATVGVFQPQDELFRKQLKKNLVFNFFKENKWGSYFLVQNNCNRTTNLTDFTLINTTPGKTDGLRWAEMSLNDESKTPVKVHFAGISMSDIHKAVGTSTTEHERFGMDFSGIDYKGRRVMGLVPGGAASSTVEADLDLLWPVPDHWTLQEAATVPLPYAIAAYCFTIREQLRPSASVFVTNGASAIGQALISLCLAVGCAVYTCVGDPYKKRLLMKIFPQLNEQNIGSSYDSIMAWNSKTRRCDLVVNCLSGIMREYAMKCVGFYGIFLDLATYDLKRNKILGMFYLEEDRTYKTVDVTNIFRLERSDEKKILQRVISEGIKKGYVRPISQITFAVDEVPRAFRLLSLNRQVGKVLIKIRDQKYLVSPSGIVPRLTFSTNGVYIVVCDETELGIELVSHLITRGARNLILNMRKKSLTGYLHTRISQWTNAGACVRISLKNLQKESDCVEIFKNLNNEQIDGIFIVQERSGSEEFNKKDFDEIRNKVISLVANVDLVLRDNCIELKHLVVISRASRNPIDEYASSAVEEICKTRTENGLPALVFNTPLFDEPHLIKTAFNALDKGMQQKCTTLFGYNVNTAKPGDFIQKLSDVIGVRNIDEIDENMSVKDLVYDDVVLVELNDVIKNNTGIEYNIEDLKDITISSLKSISHLHQKQYTRFGSGLGAFFSSIELEEMTASEVVISMSHRDSPGSSELKLNANDTYIMLIPGFGGHCKVFDTIYKQLKIGAVALQLGPDATSNDSVQDMAAYIKKFMAQRFVMKSKFYLLGYSFGVNIALEIAALLEKDGLEGVVFCLDCSPDALKAQIDAYLGEPNRSQLENAILEHFYSLFTSKTMPETLKKQIELTHDWSDKVDVCIHHIKNDVRLSKEYMTALMNSAYSRIKVAKSYEPNLKLNSELVLFKGVKHPKCVILPADYNLSNYTNKPVKIYNISSDFSTAADDSKVPIFVNKMLDAELVENYERTQTSLN